MVRWRFSAASRVALAWVVLVLAACTGGASEVAAGGTDAPPGIAQLDLPPSQPPDSTVESSVDPSTVDLCGVVSDDVADQLLEPAAAASVATEETTATVDPFGRIRTCRWSSVSSTRGLSLALTASGPDLAEFLGISLLTDATLGFDRVPVDLGDVAVAQVADSSSQGVSRLCVAASENGVMWLGCLEDTEAHFTLDGPDLNQLVDALDASFGRL